MNYVFGQELHQRHAFQSPTICRSPPSRGPGRLSRGRPVAGASPGSQSSRFPEWQRWNDYGIGLLLEGDKGSEKGELHPGRAGIRAGRTTRSRRRPAESGPRLFQGRPARRRRGRAAARRALRSARTRWTVAWLNGLVNKQNGYLDKAITEFRSILEDRYPELDRAASISARITRSSTNWARPSSNGQAGARRQAGGAFLEQAASPVREDPRSSTPRTSPPTTTSRSSTPSSATPTLAEHHRRLHERYRPDDNARDRAVAIARRQNPAADHAAQAIVIYPLQRPGAPGLNSVNLTTAADGTRWSPAR